MRPEYGTVRMNGLKCFFDTSAQEATAKINKYVNIISVFTSVSLSHYLPSRPPQLFPHTYLVLNSEFLRKPYIYIYALSFYMYKPELLNFVSSSYFSVYMFIHVESVQNNFNTIKELHNYNNIVHKMSQLNAFSYD